eukprot:m.58595 g.58595  ORF g.58595 m.58595 type:complete len:902 (-) comp11187_c0_seq2:298-3003(-)
MAPPGKESKDAKWQRSLLKKLRRSERSRLKLNKDNGGGTDPQLLKALREAGLSDELIEKEKRLASETLRLKPLDGTSHANKDGHTRLQTRVAPTRPRPMIRLKFQIASSNTPSDVLDILKEAEKSGRLTPDGVSHGWYQLVQLSKPPSNFLFQMTEDQWNCMHSATTTIASKLTQTDYTKIVWSLGKIFQRFQHGLKRKTRQQDDKNQVFTSVVRKILGLFYNTASSNDILEDLDAQGVATFLYSHGILGKYPTQDFIDKLCSRLLSITHLMNAQDLSNSMWGMASMGWRRQSELNEHAALVTQFTNIHDQFGIQELSMFLWGLASLSNIPSLNNRTVQKILQSIKICQGASTELQFAMEPVAIINILWAMTKIDALASHNKMIVARTAMEHQLGLCLDSCETKGEKMSVQCTVRACYLLGKLETGPQMVDRLLSQEHVWCQLNSQDIGEVALAMACTRGVTQLSNLCCRIDDLVKQCADTTTSEPRSLSWQMFGLVDCLDRKLDGSVRQTISTLKAYKKLGKEACKIMSQFALDVENQIVSLLTKAISKQSQSSLKRRVLLVNSFSDYKDIKQMAKEKGWKVKFWSRVAYSDVPGQAWPDSPCTGNYELAVCRLPSTHSAAKMMLAAILPLLTTNSSIFISGTVSEGIKNFAPSLRKYFSSVECIDKCSVLQQDTYGIETGLEDVVVYQATGKKSEEVDGMLKSWKSQESVKILETQRKWIVYPGLFSGGVLDPMTLFFLQNIPKPKPNSNILDVGSGSGIIAGWLQSVEPSIHLHLVDSDAVALKAAKKNVKGAKYTCAWSVSNLQGGDKFDWVVSNPPVHQGLVPSFNMLKDLLKSIPSLLSSDGKAFLVTQTYVPLSLVHSCDMVKEAKVLAWNPKFTVWELSSPNPRNRKRKAPCD